MIVLIDSICQSKYLPGENSQSLPPLEFHAICMVYTVTEFICLNFNAVVRMYINMYIAYTYVCM